MTDQDEAEWLGLEIEADTDLRERAVAAVDSFVEKHGCPVARAQIAGLRQVAANEPGELVDFAENQRRRADARMQLARGDRQEHFAAEASFWELVRALCNGTAPKYPWSLTQARDQALPAGLRVEKQPPGARLSKEEHAAIKERKDRRDAWHRRWESGRYAAFFQRFCAHYLYHLARQEK
jgi:hypothetical protein